MLEFLKPILGDHYTEDIDKQISAEIGKGFVAKADFNATAAAKKAAEAQLATANATIESYKGMDIEAIRASADKYKAEAEQAKKDADARVAAVQFDAKLDNAILGAKGRNAKAIKALLDVEALSGSKEQEKDITAALEALKTDSGFLFEGDNPTPPPYAAGTGSAAVMGTVDKAAFEKMGYRDRVALKHDNPEAYAKLTASTEAAAAADKE